MIPVPIAGVSAAEGVGERLRHELGIRMNQYLAILVARNAKPSPPTSMPLTMETRAL